MPSTLSAVKSVATTRDVDLLRSYIDRGIKDIISVPCSITDTWHELAAQAAARGELKLVLTTHEANLAGIAAGIYSAQDELHWCTCRTQDFRTPRTVSYLSQTTRCIGFRCR
jgi:hypothetical protein